MEKTKSRTVPVQFQYGAHSAGDRNSFQDHHTLFTSYNNKTGTGDAKHAKYVTERTSSTLCTYPQATKTGSQTRRLISLEISPAPAQRKDFVNRLPLMKQDILSHSKIKIKSSVKLGILEEVKEHTDWVNSSNCGKGLWKSPLPKSHNQEETDNLFGS